MSSYLLGGVNAVAFLLCAAFLAYVACIVVPLLRHRPGPTGDPSQFDWHFLIPCLNEEQVIAGTVADLLAKFPASHLWCIDDASSDGTLHILNRLTSRNRQIHVVRRRLPEARKGKGPALNAGWRALIEHLPPGTDLSRIIVGVIDADGILDPRCERVISGPQLFGNPDISAVQILVRVVNQSGEVQPLSTRILTRMQDMEFSSVIAAMQLLRRHVGSSAMGGNGQFTRASALQTITEVYGTPWQTALLEDFELGLRVLLTGGSTDYCHDTWVAQQGPPTIGRLMRQRCRWAQGLMQCFRYFMPIMRSREITTGAAMEIAVFLLLPWFQLLGIVVYSVAFVVMCAYAVTSSGGPLHWFGSGAWGLVPLFLIFGLTPLALWGPIYRRTAARDMSWSKGVALGWINWPYSYIHHVATLWAFGRMVRSRHDWKKTERITPATILARRPSSASATAATTTVGTGRPRPAGVAAARRSTVGRAASPVRIVLPTPVGGLSRTRPSPPFGSGAVATSGTDATAAVATSGTAGAAAAATSGTVAAGAMAASASGTVAAGTMAPSASGTAASGTAAAGALAASAAGTAAAGAMAASAAGTAAAGAPPADRSTAEVLTAAGAAASAAPDAEEFEVTPPYVTPARGVRARGVRAPNGKVMARGVLRVAPLERSNLLPVRRGDDGGAPVAVVGGRLRLAQQPPPDTTGRADGTGQPAGQIRELESVGSGPTQP